MSYPRILLYIPIAPTTPKLFGESFQSVMRLEWPFPIDIMIGRNDTPNNDKYADLASKHNHARQLVLDNDYDGLMFVENDMIVAPHALQALINLDTDVAYGLYCNRHGYHRWLSFFHVDGYHGASHSQSNELMDAVWGKVAETKGVGMGCTLIKRHVLKAIEFRTVDDNIVADDWLFSLDCIEHGFKQMHDFDVVCGHIMPDGNVIWPNPNAYNGYQIEFKDDGQPIRIDADNPLNVNVGARTVFVHGVNDEG